MKGVVVVSVVLYSDEVCPSVEPLFPKRGQVLVDFVGVLYGFTLLSDHFVVFLSAHLSLYCGTFGLARFVDFRRCFLDASGDVVVLGDRR